MNVSTVQKPAVIAEAQPPMSPLFGGTVGVRTDVACADAIERRFGDGGPSW